ncbi:MAG: RNA-binding S4 domain-containing protein [Candidatus Cryptobacteroides sp.]
MRESLDTTGYPHSISVQVNGNNSKPSKLVKPGDKITVRKGPAQLSYRVKLGLNNRVGAALVSNYVENITPESELAKLHAPTETFFVRRDKGSGRPTKKERRILEELWDNI